MDGGAAYKEQGEKREEVIHSRQPPAGNKLNSS